MSLAENENTVSTIFKRVLILVCIMSAFAFILTKNYKMWIYGFVFGTSINFLNFRLMSIALSKSVNLPKNKIMPYVMGNYMIRYTIYGLVLGIAAVADYLDFIAVIIGMFSVKIVILSDTFYGIIKKRVKK